MSGTPPPAETPARPITPEEGSRLFALGNDAGCILLAVSGGPDSMALMALMAQWHETLGQGPSRQPPRLCIATVDHGLRSGSHGEAMVVARAASGLGLSHSILHWTGAKPRAGLQEAARHARYSLLLAHATAIGASHVVTAHTLDDQAETVLLRLAAGSGPAGLAGMRPIAALGLLKHWRPLLGVPKARLVATCQVRGIGVVTDPSNSLPRFARSRWRKLMPLLQTEGLTPARLARLAKRQARANAALDGLAAAALGAGSVLNGQVRFDWSGLLGAADEIQVRGLALALRHAQAHFKGDKDTSSPFHAPRPFLKLERLEALAVKLAQASWQATHFRATLGGMVITLEHGMLHLCPELPRRRGADKARVDSSGIASLGKGDARA